MSDNTKKLLHKIAANGVALMAIIAVFAAVYSHMWLQAMDTPTRNVMMIFSENASSQESLMQNMRLFGVFISVVVYSMLIPISISYERYTENPLWEAKKGMVGHFIVFSLGILMYVLLHSSSDLIIQTMGPTLSITSGVSVIGHVISIMQLSSDGS